MIPLVGQAIAIGDARPFVSALLVLDPDVAPQWAADNGIDVSTLEELADDGLAGLSPIEGVPVTIFVKPDGTVHAVYTGFSGPATGAPAGEGNRAPTRRGGGCTGDGGH